MASRIHRDACTVTKPRRARSSCQDDVLRELRVFVRSGLDRVRLVALYPERSGEVAQPRSLASRLVEVLRDRARPRTPARGPASPSRSRRTTPCPGFVPCRRWPAGRYPRRRSRSRCGGCPRRGVERIALPLVTPVSEREGPPHHQVHGFGRPSRRVASAERSARGRPRQRRSAARCACKRPGLPHGPSLDRETRGTSDPRRSTSPPSSSGSPLRAQTGRMADTSSCARRRRSGSRREGRLRSARQSARRERSGRRSVRAGAAAGESNRAGRRQSAARAD